MVNVNVDVPDVLHKKFKMKVLSNDELIKDKIISFIERYVKGEIQ